MGRSDSATDNAPLDMYDTTIMLKPRDQWHTFWNAGYAPARILEIISPAGFENYFREQGAELISGPLIRNDSRRSARTTRSTWI